MNKFEYKLVTYHMADDFVHFWNTLGNDRWEYCMEVPGAGNKGSHIFLVKRVKI